MIEGSENILPIIVKRDKRLDELPPDLAPQDIGKPMPYPSIGPSQMNDGAIAQQFLDLGEPLQHGIPDNPQEALMILRRKKRREQGS